MSKTPESAPSPVAPRPSLSAEAIAADIYDEMAYAALNEAGITFADDQRGFILQGLSDAVLEFRRRLLAAQPGAPAERKPFPPAVQADIDAGRKQHLTVLMPAGAPAVASPLVSAEHALALKLIEALAEECDDRREHSSRRCRACLAQWELTQPGVKPMLRALLSALASAPAPSAPAVHGGEKEK